MDTFSCESQMTVAKQATDEQTQLRRSVTSLHIPIYSHTVLQPIEATIKPRFPKF